MRFQKESFFDNGGLLIPMMDDIKLLPSVTALNGKAAVTCMKGKQSANT